ncbi:VOC family protein [Moritella dasanensis]|uniref:VOC family protein n=1 Tax=Moritella dasanensis TaxID=428031 RepID=UPI0003695F0C|nr:VOC family protein [Moritella dasanensis]
MLEVLAIDHIVLRTTKLKEMLDFYTNILSCTIERETALETGLTQLRAGSALIDLVVVNSRLGAVGGGPPSKTERNVDHFCLQIKTVPEQEIISFLKNNGIEVGEFASRYGAQGEGNSIYIQDPEGNGVELRCRI